MQIFGLGLPELIVISLILLLFFGSKRLPGLFRSIGTSINELKSGLQEGETINNKESRTDETTQNTENGTKSQ